MVRYGSARFPSAGAGDRPEHAAAQLAVRSRRRRGGARGAARSGADVIILELEDFTPPELRAKARALSGKAFASWRAAGAVAAVRINPLETCGREDLAGLARADLV